MMIGCDLEVFDYFCQQKSKELMSETKIVYKYFFKN